MWWTLSKYQGDITYKAIEKYHHRYITSVSTSSPKCYFSPPGLTRIKVSKILRVNGNRIVYSDAHIQSKVIQIGSKRTVQNDEGKTHTRKIQKRTQKSGITEWYHDTSGMRRNQKARETKRWRKYLAHIHTNRYIQNVYVHKMHPHRHTYTYICTYMYLHMEWWKFIFVC